MQFTMIGTGSASGIPVYGCDCISCISASECPELQRQETSAMLSLGGRCLMFDASAKNFQTRFPYGSYDAICLTHFHMDHVSALFNIRWGVGEKIPVYHPRDNKGADDLFKHPGILDFKMLEAFEPFKWQEVTITPVPLNHSRPTYGYVIDYEGTRLAYLTDSAWLPEDTLAFLAQKNIAHLFLDTAHPPQEKPPRNHHDVEQAKQVFEMLNPDKMGLIHLSHDALNWALDNSDFFNERFYLVRDNDSFDF